MKLPEDIKNRILQIWGNVDVAPDNVPSIQKFVHEIFEKTLMEYTLNHKMDEDAQYHILIEISRSYPKADSNRTEAIEAEMAEVFHTSVEELHQFPIRVWRNPDEHYRCFWSEEKLPFDTEYLYFNQGISKKLMGNHILTARFWKNDKNDLFDAGSVDLITVYLDADSKGCSINATFNQKA